MKIIHVENLKYKYPDTDKLVLDDISFNVEKGEVIGIIGANGSGKSTLCQALVGLVPNFYKGQYGGKVMLDSLEVMKTPIYELTPKIGIVFENPFTQITGSKLTVFEEIAFGLENMGIPRDEMIDRIDESLKMLDIYEYKDRGPFQLSGGQMQRMAIASIIAMKPDIIVFDEPTSQLDPQGTEEVFKAIQKLSEEGMTIIIVEHKIEKLAQYCNKIILLHEGKIIDYDFPEVVLSREDLEDYNMEYPVYTEICRGLNLKNNDRETYPVTLKEAYDLMVKRYE